MKTSTMLALMAVAILTAGCATLQYDGMPTKDEPHAMAIEEGNVNFVVVDGRPVHRPAFSTPKLLLRPGRHEIVIEYDEELNDTDYVGDVEIAITVHYWSRYAHTMGFTAEEGNRYYLGADAKLPSTTVSYESWCNDLPPDYPTDQQGRVNITVDHELTEPDDWRPIITRILPIKKYWRSHATPMAVQRDGGPSAD